MRVLVTGATGLVGQKLCVRLIEQNAKLVVVGRDEEPTFRQKFSLPCEYVHWDALDQMKNIDAVFHLAGDPIASSRWSASKKKSILDSRVETTNKLAAAFSKSQQWPKVFIGASAVGYYGDRGDEVLDEGVSPGQNFLSEVCVAWENSSKPFAQHSRLVTVRIGVVLDAEGGFLHPMQELFCAGLGGRTGSGRQWMSWVHSHDLVNMLVWALNNDGVCGTFNAVAPNPITNSEWTTAYAAQLKVSACFHAPKLALKLALGEMSILALASLRASAKKSQELGFEFKYSEIKTALTHVYSWKAKPSERLFVGQQWIPKSKEEVFPFFSEVKNLEKITPPWLNFKVKGSSTENIQSGTLIDYKLKVRGLPINWQTEIQNWDPPNKFVDNQISGPYRRWHHTHTFKSFAGGTLMGDRVIYEVPLGRLGQLAGGSYIKKDVSKIFGHRQKIIHSIFK